jgi:hypothetical protein
VKFIKHFKGWAVSYKSLGTSVLLILDLGTRWGMSGQRHAPAALYQNTKLSDITSHTTNIDIFAAPHRKINVSRGPLLTSVSEDTLSYFCSVI